MEKSKEKILSPENTNEQIRERMYESLKNSKVLQEIRDKVGSFEDNKGVSWQTAEECWQFLGNKLTKEETYSIREEYGNIGRKATNEIGQLVTVSKKRTAPLSRDWWNHKLTGSTPFPDLVIWPDRKRIDFYTKDGIKRKIEVMLKSLNELESLKSKSGLELDLLRIKLEDSYLDLQFLQDKDLIPNEHQERTKEYLDKVGEYLKQTGSRIFINKNLP